jgi:hypothetical protein
MRRSAELARVVAVGEDAERSRALHDFRAASLFQGASVL